MNIDWNSIRPLNGSQREGFEELATQLARDEIPSDARFERIGAPDSGVECYCVLDDGSEWGWQAKYFTSSLTNGQWRQLDDSIKKALNGHPRLVRYFVCIPWDRSHSPKSGQTTALQKWEERVSKWEGWAHDRDMDVEFVWWGASELIERLSQEKHIGRVFFWFSNQYLSEEWYSERIDEAIESAGPRYTPELHVDVPIAMDIKMFGRTEDALNQIKSLALAIRRARRHVSLTKEDRDKLGQHIDLAELMQSTAVVLKAFSDLESSPDGELQLASIVAKIETAAERASQCSAALVTLSRENGPRPDGYGSRYGRDDPFQNAYSRVIQLEYSLTEALEEVKRAEELANARVMILKGPAGVGKTHLLCDVVRGRLEDGAPTVLLMGQRFTDSSDPWVQILQQLDMSEAKADQFVGALECSAQAANCRALLIVDALNEGRGRVIWPPHLSAFLSQVEKSPWVDVVLSVRSSYEEEVIPTDVSDRAIIKTHAGFEGLEYDALRTYCEHYGIEFPSTPILQPEFTNPLLLKLMCEGLQAKGERRFPRGFNGATTVFGLYVASVNSRLALSLDYNPNDNLVLRALENVAEQMIDSDSNMRWLPRQRAEGDVNELLPGRGYRESLYRGLIVEGLLTEEGAAFTGGTEEVVRFTYERFSDHIIVDFLLRRHLDLDNPEAAFAEEGGLAFLSDKGVYTPRGILEALFIQTPERTGQELVKLAPSILENWRYIGSEFLSSLVWRSPDAISADTFEVLRGLEEQKIVDREEILESILTVSIMPGHPFNAEFLDNRLRHDTMPDRDAWWSIYLHDVWEYEKGSVHRLVHWASSTSTDDEIEDDVVDLATTTLAWMLTTSNRFVRDKATKALVCLLTDRLDAAVRMVIRFDDVDDPYVRERIYAVAYGVAMRSSDASQVEKIACAVYENIFASGSPPAHIFLREYALGVVQRALHICPSIGIDRELIRPPFKSIWPEIPDEEALEKLTPHRDDGQGNWGTVEWARNRVRWSVMDDDFARYIIGTNSSSRSTRWLALELEDNTWESPEDRLGRLLQILSEDERLAWEEFNGAAQEIHERFKNLIHISYEASTDRDLEFVIETPEEREKLRGLAEKELLSALSEDNRLEMEGIWEMPSEDPPGFDLSLAQRYILNRVFELGWTTERFGQFDSFTIGDHGRDATKAERIGKKYQWIAYYEFLAYLADNYKYRPSQGKSDWVFQGTWQDSYPYRDIDPSCTLTGTTGGTGWGEHNSSWWAQANYDDWQVEASHQTWLETENDAPKIEDLLKVSSPDSKDNWVVAEGHYVWQQSWSADLEPYDIPRRELWMMCRGYFVRRDDVEEFMKWASGVDFSGRWMPEPPDVYPAEMYLGEYGWSPAFERFTESYEFPDAGGMWLSGRSRSPVPTRTASFGYNAESNTFDCSIEDSFKLYVPDADYIYGNELEWSGYGAEFVNSEGKLAAIDPTVLEDGPSALLLREDILSDYLNAAQVSLCWVVIGEKRIIGGRGPDNTHKFYKLSGACALTESGINGFVNWPGAI